MSQLALDHGQRPDTDRWAQISPCGTYRYLLGRRWDEGCVLPWIMLNPSTADADTDDPTVRRVVQFSHDAGYRAAIVVNLFALRSPDPKALRSHPDPVGPGNDPLLTLMAQGLEREATILDRLPAAVAAWGAKAPADRVSTVMAILAGINLWCLGTTKAGHPRHPLYVPADQPLVPWEPA